MNNLLYIITRTELGGAQRHLFELINYFKASYHVSMICGEKDWLYHEAQALGVKVLYVKELVRNISPINDVIAVNRIKRHIRLFNVNLVHAHSTKAGFVGRLAAFSCKIPVIFTAHGWGFHPEIPFIRRYYVRIIEKILGLKTDKIICVSNYDRDLAIKYKIAAKHKLVTIYNGLPDTAYRKEFQARSDVVKIVMVARFNQQKNQTTLLQAFQLLNKSVKCELHFIGDGPKLLAIKNFAKSDNRVTFHGSKMNVEEMLPDFDIFVLCSNWEGLPISIIEAMRCGLPVLASDTGGVKEMFVGNENGLLFVDDARILAKKLTVLIEDMPQRELQESISRNTYLECFGIQSMVVSVQDNYRDCLKAA